MRQHLLLALLLAGSLGAQAQIHKMERTDSSMTTRTYNLNPVVVTGSGHHQRLKSTATPVHVLSAQEIHEQGITNFGDALTRMMPQASMAPNSMGTFLRLNGLGNKYILILINGQKLSGDISNNVDLSRINMSRVKRIEILDGAASSLYGSDAIAGVINIITDQPTQHLISVASDTRVSGHGQFTEASIRTALAPTPRSPTTAPTAIRTTTRNTSRAPTQSSNRRSPRSLRAIDRTSSDRNLPMPPQTIWLSMRA